VPTYLTPGAAVVAFELSNCPSGWEDFKAAQGRMIVGIGQANESSSERTLLEKGCSEKHALTVEELPAHSHPGNVSSGGLSVEHHQANSGLPVERWSKESGSVGEGQPHENMPPFVALRYCKKV
jgi:microcystin-dependent protein